VEKLKGDPILSGTIPFILRSLHKSEVELHQVLLSFVSKLLNCKFTVFFALAESLSM